ncbi:unnamed protein product, partial [Amoebophrya sp. A120]
KDVELVARHRQHSEILNVNAGAIEMQDFGAGGGDVTTIELDVATIEVHPRLQHPSSRGEDLHTRLSAIEASEENSSDGDEDPLPPDFVRTSSSHSGVADDDHGGCLGAIEMVEMGRVVDDDQHDHSTQEHLPAHPNSSSGGFRTAMNANNKNAQNLRNSVSFQEFVNRERITPDDSASQRGSACSSGDEEADKKNPGDIKNGKKDEAPAAQQEGAGSKIDAETAPSKTTCCGKLKKCCANLLWVLWNPCTALLRCWSGKESDPEKKAEEIRKKQDMKRIEREARIEMQRVADEQAATLWRKYGVPMHFATLAFQEDGLEAKFCWDHVRRNKRFLRYAVSVVPLVMLAMVNSSRHASYRAILVDPLVMVAPGLLLLHFLLGVCTSLIYRNFDVIMFLFFLISSVVMVFTITVARPLVLVEFDHDRDHWRPPEETRFLPLATNMQLVTFVVVSCTLFRQKFLMQVCSAVTLILLLYGAYFLALSRHATIDGWRICGCTEYGITVIDSNLETGNNKSIPPGTSQAEDRLHSLHQFFDVPELTQEEDRAYANVGEQCDIQRTSWCVFNR